MSKLAGQILTTRGVTAFWLSWCAAFVLWLANIDPDLISRRAVPPGSGLSAARSLGGALVFITGTPLVFLPWIAFVLLFAWRFRRRRRHSRRCLKQWRSGLLPSRG